MLECEHSAPACQRARIPTRQHARKPTYQCANISDAL